jgi:hypothetical protein
LTEKVISLVFDSFVTFGAALDPDFGAIVLEVIRIMERHVENEVVL